MQSPELITRQGTPFSVRKASFGFDAEAGEGGIAAGQRAQAREDGIALGDFAMAGEGAIALGHSALAIHEGQISIRVHGEDVIFVDSKEKRMVIMGTEVPINEDLGEKFREALLLIIDRHLPLEIRQCKNCGE